MPLGGTWRREPVTSGLRACDFGVISDERAPGVELAPPAQARVSRVPFAVLGLSALLSIRWQRGAAAGCRGQGWGLGVLPQLSNLENFPSCPPEMMSPTPWGWAK